MTACMYASRLLNLFRQTGLQKCGNKLALDEVHWIYGTMSQDISPLLAHNNVTSLYFPIFLSALCSKGYTLYCIPRSKMLLDWIYYRMFCKQCYILGGGYLSICPGRALCPFFTQMFDPSPSTSRGEGTHLRI